VKTAEYQPRRVPQAEATDVMFFDTFLFLLMTHARATDKIAGGEVVHSGDAKCGTDAPAAG